MRGKWTRTYSKRKGKHLPISATLPAALVRDVRRVAKADGTTITRTISDALALWCSMAPTCARVKKEK